MLQKRDIHLNVLPYAINLLSFVLFSVISQPVPLKVLTFYEIMTSYVNLEHVFDGEVSIKKVCVCMCVCVLFNLTSLSPLFQAYCESAYL